MPFFLGSKFRCNKKMTTFQFTKNNMLDSFVTQMFIDSIHVNKFKKKKTKKNWEAKKRPKLK